MHVKQGCALQDGQLANKAHSLAFSWLGSISGMIPFRRQAGRWRRAGFEWAAARAGWFRIRAKNRCSWLAQMSTGIVWGIRIGGVSFLWWHGTLL